MFITNLYSHSRIAFSRPGSFIRTPSSIIDQNNNQYYVGFSNETINTNNNISANSIFFKASNINGYEYGISYVKRAPMNHNETSPAELSFHFNKEIYAHKNFIINLGIHDVMYKTEEENQISVFITLINKNINIGSDFKMQSAVGFGSGRINSDSYNYNESFSDAPNIFVGVKIDTPLFQKRGGLKILSDYDGSGLNVGASLFITKNVNFKLGITHFENVVKFNSLKTESNETIYDDSPGLSLGFDFSIPRKKTYPQHFSDEETPCSLNFDETSYYNPLSINKECSDLGLNHLVVNINKMYENLNDSLMLINHELIAAKNFNLEKESKINILKDSIYVQYLNQKILYSEINIGMKFLSNSLKYYYLEEYQKALKEVEHAQQYLPKLAYSYARKGSIYYKLGDSQRASMNWNIALELDPEYEEVRQMLISLQIADKNNSIDLSN